METEAEEFKKAWNECKIVMPNASEETLNSCAQVVLLRKILDKNLRE